MKGSDLVPGLNVTVFCLGVWCQTRITIFKNGIYVFPDLNAFHVQVNFSFQVSVDRDGLNHHEERAKLLRSPLTLWVMGSQWRELSEKQIFDAAPS